MLEEDKLALSFHERAANESLDPVYAQFRDQTRFWIQRVAVPLIMVVGLFGNLVTMIIMTRRRMRSTTNMYLAALAFVDMLYLVLTFLLGLSHYPNMADRRYYFYWQLKPSLMMLTDACSNTSVWLTVTFTIERFIAVKYPMKGKVWCTEARAKKLIICVFLAGILFAAPVPFEWKVIEKPLMRNQTGVTNLVESFHDRSKTRLEGDPVNLDGKLHLDLRLNDLPNADGRGRANSKLVMDTERKHPKGFKSEIELGRAQQQQQANSSAIREGANDNNFILSLDYSDFGRNETYKTIYYWSTAVIFYFIPLLSLTFFNGFLILSVHRSLRERKRMTSGQQTQTNNHQCNKDLKHEARAASLGNCEIGLDSAQRMKVGRLVELEAEAKLGYLVDKEKACARQKAVDEGHSTKIQPNVFDIPKIAVTKGQVGSEDFRDEEEVSEKNKASLTNQTLDNIAIQHNINGPNERLRMNNDALEFDRAKFRESHFGLDFIQSMEDNAYQNERNALKTFNTNAGRDETFESVSGNFSDDSSLKHGHVDKRVEFNCDGAGDGDAKLVVHMNCDKANECKGIDQTHNGASRSTFGDGNLEAESARISIVVPILRTPHNATISPSSTTKIISQTNQLNISDSVRAFNLCKHERKSSLKDNKLLACSQEDLQPRRSASTSITTTISQQNSTSRKISGSSGNINHGKGFSNFASNNNNHYGRTHQKNFTPASAKTNNSSIHDNNGSCTTIQTTTSILPASTQERRITIMLIAVVILFLCCQIPTAAMLLYTSVRELVPNTNEHELVLAFGNIFNFLMAVNAAGNFILYSFLSKKYRRTFVILFCGCFKGKTEKLYERARLTYFSSQQLASHPSTSSSGLAADETRASSFQCTNSGGRVKLWSEPRLMRSGMNSTELSPTQSKELVGGGLDERRRDTLV